MIIIFFLNFNGFLNQSCYIVNYPLSIFLMLCIFIDFKQHFLLILAKEISWLRNFEKN
jgi:hypothetical protein